MTLEKKYFRRGRDLYDFIIGDQYESFSDVKCFTVNHESALGSNVVMIYEVSYAPITNEPETFNADIPEIETGEEL